VWNNNSQFAAIHTQSTRSSATNGGCFSGGGLDDRFDQILISNAIMNNTDQIKFKNNSYKAIGNDGLHFNKAIKDGTNNSVPSSILNALYDLSDHLPVVMDIEIEKMTLSSYEDELNSATLKFKNPVSDELVIQLNELSKAKDLTIYSLKGQQISTTSFNPLGDQLIGVIRTEYLSKGIYILEISTINGQVIRQKFLKN
jgi:hypothetical protein